MVLWIKIAHWYLLLFWLHPFRYPKCSCHNIATPVSCGIWNLEMNLNPAFESSFSTYIGYLSARIL